MELIVFMMVSVVRFRMFQFIFLLHFYIKFHFLFDRAEQICVQYTLWICIQNVFLSNLICGTVSADSLL